MEIDLKIDEDDEFITLNAYLEPIVLDNKDQTHIDLFVIF
jgi:hypothetical protein